MLQLVLFKSLWWYHVSIYVWQTAKASYSPFCRDNHKGLSFETFGNTSTQNFLSEHNGHSLPCAVQTGFKLLHCVMYKNARHRGFI